MYIVSIKLTTEPPPPPAIQFSLVRSNTLAAHCGIYSLHNGWVIGCSPLDSFPLCLAISVWKQPHHLTDDNDVRLPRILSISASPSGYVIVYEMDFQLAPILTSISSLYNSQSNPNTVYNGLQLSNDVVDIPVTGTLNATTLIAADQVVDFVLNTVVGLYVYKSPVYTLNPNIVSTCKHLCGGWCLYSACVGYPSYPTYCKVL